MNRYILWRPEWDAGRAKWQKFPMSPHTGETINAHDPAHHVDAATANAQAAARGLGVALVLTADDPLFALDLDHCLQGGQWSPRAAELCQRFAGAYVEIGYSGDGLHIIGSYAGPEPAHGCKNVAEGLELYTSGRFIALTGSGAMGSMDSDQTTALYQTITELFPAPAGGTGGEVPDEGPRSDWNGHADDEDLLAAALGSGSAAAVFGGGVTFSDLWHGDEEALGRKWPDPEQGRAYDASHADAALAQHLAFWTGCDQARMERLMRESALVREKWERADYLPRTIARACERQTDVHKRGGQGTGGESAGAAAGGAQVAQGSRFLTAQQQLEFFSGCIYLRDPHRVLTPDGAKLRPEQFRAQYGGWTFALDPGNEKTTRNAWEALTENQAADFPKAIDTMFRPDWQPGEVRTVEGSRYVNNYVPQGIERVEGDPAPFLDHVQRLLPHDDDREKLMAYMAAVVQHPGVKFQWCPLIQGVEGNGKTLLSAVVAEAVGRRLVHSPRSTEISGKFNSWIRDRVFVYVEDVYLPDAKREVIETLKPLITNEWQPVEAKGQDQVTAYVVANFILNSNHMDAIRKTENDRRFAPFFTAQQEEADLQTWGMGGDYFPRLYQWLRSGGYGVVARYLDEYPIPDELNPATLCHRAPTTSSTERAIEESRTDVEQHILEAIGEERTGFAGGWVSSHFLDKLLDDLRLSSAVPPRRRRDLMRSLGYDWHPALRNGRTNNPVMPDGTKPRLYVRDGHLALNITSPAEAARAYAEAQGVVGANQQQGGA